MVSANTPETPGGAASSAGTPRSIHDVVIRASVKRGWGVKEESAERVVVYLNQRKNEATISITLAGGPIQETAANRGISGVSFNHGDNDDEYRDRILRHVRV